MPRDEIENCMRIVVDQQRAFRSFTQPDDFKFRRLMRVCEVCYVVNLNSINDLVGLSAEFPGIKIVGFVVVLEKHAESARPIIARRIPSFQRAE